MDVYSLAQRLQDPDPRVRVETLRILAMVEETRALGAIGWVFKNDPEPGVREVANWAGRLIYAAQKRGHSTQRAVEDMFAGSLMPELQARFLESLERNLGEIGKTGHKSTRRFAADQDYRRRLDEVMRSPEELALLEQSNDDAPAALPAPSTPAKPDTDDDDNLLAAGLIDLDVE